jgi:dihydropyrimidinase
MVGRQNDQPRPGRGKLVKRQPFPAVNKALSTWKELTAPRAVTRSAEHMPIGV